MKPYRTVAGLMFCVALVAGGLSLPAAEPDVLRSKQEAQQRARAMARELVASVLDIQLQQLEENGLTELPLYTDIAGMKKNLSLLVERDMGQVVALLVKAQQGTRPERDQAFKDARGMIRDVVIKLSIERQNLLRRLRTAELTAQVRRLIELQSNVLKTTRALPDRPVSEQEKLALTTIEDQRDVKHLFLHLVDNLADVSRWDGAVGAGATDGLRILQAAGVGKELDLAGRNLQSTLYLDATKNQQSVIKGLRLLLEKLQETQGLLNTDRESALAAVRDLIKKQEQVREETKQTDLASPDAEKVVEAQAEVRKELGKLSQQLENTPAAEDLLEQAKAAAYEATGKLFDAQQENAVAEQGKVLGNLAEIEQQLLAATEQMPDDRSAAEMAAQVKDLEQAKAQIEQVQKQQETAAATAPENPAGAKQQEQQVAENVAKIDDGKELPKGVESRLTAAEEAAKSAAEALEAAAQAPAEKAKAAEAVKKADRAVEMAAAEINAALADAKRQEQAVKIGELARAAETLERAAAAERELGDKAAAAADAKGLTPDEAKNLKAEQADIKKIAEKVAEGVQALASEAGKPLAEAIQAAAAAEKELAAAEQKPGTPSKGPAEQAANEAEKTANKLAEAAREIREEVAAAAEQLARESGDQLKGVAEAREAVEMALRDQTDPLGKRLERLAAAEDKVREAAAEQARAAGRPEAAKAMELADQIADAQAAQAAAEQAADDLAQGKANTPLEATTKQQQVAEQAQDAAKAAADRPKAAENKAAGQPDPLGEALAKAEQAAAEAAKATLDGKPTQAEAARAEASEALKKARDMAQAEAAAAARAPAGKADPAAQENVGKLIEEAQQLASSDAPAAGESLQAAGAKSDEAAEAARKGEMEQTAAAQKETAAGLEKAEAQIADALKKLGEAEGQQLAKQAEKTGELAKQSAAVDPGATAALRQAEEQSEAAAAEAAAGKAPEQAAAAEAAVEKSIERAAANLNAREQRVQRDKAIAEAIAQLAKEQQMAADEIAKQRNQLQELAEAGDAAAENGDTPSGDPAHTEPGQPAGKPPAGKPAAGKPAKGEPAAAKPGKPTAAKPARPMPPTPAQKAAAQKLAQATETFAQTQRATGQGAEEVSGQEEIANKPLREALELASNLNPEEMPAGLDEPSGEGEPLGEVGENPTAAGEAPTGEAPTGEPANGENPAGNPKPGKPANGKPAPGKPASGKPAAGKPAAGKPAAGDPMPGEAPAEPGSGAEPSDSPMEPGDAAGEPPQPGNQELGTGLVPNAPERTAELMAGRKALAEAEAALGAPLPVTQQASQNPPGMPSEGQPGEPQEGQSPAEDASQAATAQSPMPKPGQPSTASKGGSTKDGEARQNQAVQDGPLQVEAETENLGDGQSAEAGPNAADIIARKFMDDPWMAKLPPELRKSIRAKSQRRAPRGYEERLQRYFESID